MLAGYIDESVDKTKTFFTLSCLTGDYGAWFWIEQEWLKVLNTKNVELAAQGRKTISRYHASDCASCLGEFKGWTVDEQLILPSRTCSRSSGDAGRNNPQMNVEASGAKPD